MNNKRGFLTGLMMILFIAVSFAQGQGQRMQARTPEETAKTETEWMMKELALAKDMEKKVYDMQLKYAKKQTEMRQAAMNSGDREAMRANMEKINTERDTEMKKLLGDKKFEEYKKKMEERMAAMRRR